MENQTKGFFNSTINWGGILIVLTAVNEWWGHQDVSRLPTISEAITMILGLAIVILRSTRENSQVSGLITKKTE